MNDMPDMNLKSEFTFRRTLVTPNGVMVDESNDSHSVYRAVTSILAESLDAIPPKHFRPELEAFAVMATGEAMFMSSHSWELGKKLHDFVGSNELSANDKCLWRLEILFDGQIIFWDEVQCYFDPTIGPDGAVAVSAVSKLARAMIQGGPGSEAAYDEHYPFHEILDNLMQSSETPFETIELIGNAAVGVCGAVSRLMVDKTAGYKRTADDALMSMDELFQSFRDERGETT